MINPFDLSPELLKIAKEELHEDPERRQKDIEYIREWLQKQPHITARTDDWTILRFLRGCKFSLENTKKKLDMFYTCKNLTPEWFSNRDPLDPKMAEILSLGEFLPLPGYDEKGRKVILIRPDKHNTNTTSMDEMVKVVHIILDLLIEEDLQQSVIGVAVLLDFQDFTPNYLLQTTPFLLKKIFTVWQEAYPMRLKAFHYINTPPAFQVILNLAKATLKEKLKQRLYVHANYMESLFSHIAKNNLPKEYGGDNGNLKEITENWHKKVNEKRNWLLEDEKYIVDESKRSGKPRTSSDLFGIEGSFRKLNID
ncbi:Alpha-tocopherol transfer protein-like [Armadillidium nasatum]|uniref:Alpha-tocopherol transfer protein-like n=1 Tax=Armadillidium nasatum TaxID=96803 RepID=A0A5N5TBK3_9CRUS|nr:Alpha-tocopherol transfer protein-like [Armadillidium nasatum]